jgi:predicted dehydrogenase
MKVLLIGCGNIGFRHLQSLLTLESLKSLTLVEKNPERLNFCVNEIRKFKPTIGLSVYQNLSDVGLVHEVFDVGISAVTADIQELIFPELALSSFRLLILEKPLTRSRAKLKELIDAYQANPKIQNVVVNCSRDMWPGQIRLKQELTKTGGPFLMTVSGYNWGFGCNALHYLELFRYYFSSHKITCLQSHLAYVKAPNKRGPQFEEYSGISLFQDELGNQFQLTVLEADMLYPRDPVFEIYQKNGTAHWSMDEKTDTFFELPSGHTWKVEQLFVSQSTALIIKKAFHPTKAQMLLPDLDKINVAHQPLFDCLEMAFKKTHFYFT